MIAIAGHLNYVIFIKWDSMQLITLNSDNNNRLSQ